MAATMDPQRTVRVLCPQGSAEECYLTGEFNHWSLPGMAMLCGGGGEWTASIRLSDSDVGKVRAVSYKGGRVVDVRPVVIGAIRGEVSKANSRSIGGHHSYVSEAS